MKFYELDRIKSVNAHWNVIFGGRSNGKSTAVCKELIDDFKANGNRFGRVLRYITDCRDNEMLNWFNSDYLANYTKERYNQSIWFDGGKWFFYPADGDPTSKRTPKEYFGEVFILNSEYRYKSAQYDHITKLVCEEFVLLNPSDYIPYEFEHFLSLVSTVNRHRTNLSVWLIGNTLNKSNPYFNGLGINIDKLKIYPGQLRTMRNNYGTLYAVEYAELSYTSENEIPEILRIDGNEIAFTDGFTPDPNVYTIPQMTKIMNTANPVYAATLIYKGIECCLYKIMLTKKQSGWAAVKNWEPYGRPEREQIKIRLDNRLIDIDRICGATIAYLRDINFDYRLCVYDSEEIKYNVITALRTY